STNLYSFSEETASRLRKFRFASARSDKIREDPNVEDSPVTSIEELVEELPDNSPRYVVLSYPLTLKDGRKSSPLVMLYWLPPTSQQSLRMLYAAAVELFREKAGVSKYVVPYLYSFMT
ncbi:Protein AIM7, partial [Cyberlindnera fabianii]